MTNHISLRHSALLHFAQCPRLALSTAPWSLCGDVGPADKQAHTRYKRYACTHTSHSVYCEEDHFSVIETHLHKTMCTDGHTL